MHGRPISKILFIACGVWLVGLGLYFVFLRPALLPEDLRYMGTSPCEIRLALPGLEHWLRRVFTVMGGFIIGAGLLTILIAMNTYALPKKWARILLSLAGVFTVGIMSLTNFQLNSAFKWLLLLPALLWFTGLVVPIFVRSSDA
jgi:hypothetical protein